MKNKGVFVQELDFLCRNGSFCANKDSAQKLITNDLLDYEAELLEDMSNWVQPQFSKGKIDRAGKVLINPPVWIVERAESLVIINNWRSSHSYPLHIIKKNLHFRAKNIDINAVIAQRLKRLSSISSKLKRNENMKLSQMQDIGGCRAVMSDMDDVERLIAIFEESFAKNPHDRAERIETYNYIGRPKPDGYRSFHYVVKYRSKAEKHRIYNGLRVEIQIRTQLQHAWATAVETVSTFTEQALKSGIGDEAWKRFFALMGSVIALRERQPTVPGTPTNTDELLSELRELVERLQVINTLQSWNTAVKIMTEQLPEGNLNAQAFLLVLDAIKKTVQITAYNQSELTQASQQYLLVEQESASKPEIQAVLVSVDSVQTLRSAFPNYYLDTRGFLDAVQLAIQS
jgi:ppGpp synthetase/RelA/SpoT-type nucleotidyltranferase